MTHSIPSRRTALLMLGSTFALSACGTRFVETGRPLGSELDEGGFGSATRQNIAYHNGDLDYGAILSQRFAETVPNTITFAFNSADLDAEARRVLALQAHFIRQFPEVRFSVYGHTDAVGSDAYNQRLGLRRAREAVNYLVHQGVNRSRLEALVSFGETRPVIATDMEERLNRRTVTEVSGFVASHPMVLDGRYAEVVYRAYRSPGAAAGTVGPGG